MKTVIGLGLALTVAAFTQTAVAATEKVVRTDRISFYKTTPSEVVTPERVKRTDRVEFNLPVVQESSSEQKRIARTDRIVFTKS